MLKNFNSVATKLSKNNQIIKRGFFVAGNGLFTRLDNRVKSGASILQDAGNETYLESFKNTSDVELQQDLPGDEVFCGSNNTYRDFVDKGIIGTLADEIPK
ncbi:hypothetical protein BB561_001001 [Smittium simulii]|uniref:Uncharacterized protein n=1 Tax=Smittium simulii TaxID=133385 RepID=A0A2T9YWM4_9FUNG|nr:hypothetical protein BB561_001001 [Smittium simulii]